MTGIKKLGSGGNGVSFAVPIKAQINLDALNELAQGTSPVLLACSYQANDVHHMLTFDTGGAHALNSIPANSNAFFSDLLAALEECKSKNLSSKNLMLEPSALFVSDNRLRFVLVPVDNQSPESFKKAVKRFIKAIVPLVKDQTIKELIRKVKRADSEDAIRQCLKNERQMTGNGQGLMQGQPENIDSSESETTLLSQSDETDGTSEAETTLLSGDEQKRASAPAFGETVLLSDAEPEMTVNAFLIRNKTGLQIPIRKPLFMIGNAGGSVDYQVDGNESISRHHASIIFEGGSCFIMDNKSTNRSFVEGSAIPPYEKIELDNGALFTLGNENFQVFMEAR